MAFRFIHTGDLHLDSPLTGLRSLDDPRANEVALAPRRAFETLVDTAIREKVDAFLIAGDLWDGDWRDISAGLFVQEQAGRLKAAGIGVFAILGNHDAATEVSHRIRNLGTLHLFGSDRPQSVPFKDAVIHGVSYGQREVQENLALTYPDGIPGKINIGLLHTSLNGREGHAPYAPCSVDELSQKGYDYWALGHVHRQEIVAHRPASQGGTIAYCGVLQGRHIQERGPKGALLVSVADGIADVRPITISHVEWAEVRADVSGNTLPKVAMELALEAIAAHVSADVMPIRVTLTGETDQHFQLRSSVRALTELAQFIASGLAGGRLLLESVAVATTPAAGPAERLPEAFGRYLQRAADDAGVRSVTGEELSKMVSSLHAGTRQLLLKRMPELAVFDAGGDPDQLLRDALARVEARLTGPREV